MRRLVYGETVWYRLWKLRWRLQRVWSDKASRMMANVMPRYVRYWVTVQAAKKMQDHWGDEAYQEIWALPNFEHPGLADRTGKPYDFSRGADGYIRRAS
jgi:hypothetical protein